MATDIDEAEILAQVVKNLVEKNPGWNPAEVERVAREELSVLAPRPVHDYLTVLTERATKKRMRERVAA